MSDRDLPGFLGAPVDSTDQNYQLSRAVRPAPSGQGPPLDVVRLALAMHNLHARSVLRMPKHGNPEHVYNVADKLAAEYARLSPIEPTQCRRCGVTMTPDEERKCSGSKFSLWCSPVEPTPGEPHD